MILCFAGISSAEPGVQNGSSLSIVHPAGGAYIIVTKLKPGVLNFKYGWNNAKQFETPAVGYWIGVYDNDVPTYVWSDDSGLLADPNPKMLKLSSIDETELVSGHSYTINFFVRNSYGPPLVTNVAVLQLTFIAP